MRIKFDNEVLPEKTVNPCKLCGEVGTVIMQRMASPTGEKYNTFFTICPNDECRAFRAIITQCESVDDAVDVWNNLEVKKQ